VAGRFIFVMGGSPDSFASGTVATLERYDPSTNTWTVMAPMAQARYDFPAVGSDQFVYAIGGGSPSGDLSSVVRYSLQNNTWTDLMPLPSVRNSFAAVAV
jgi:hypothetical protein